MDHTSPRLLRYKNTKHLEEVTLIYIHLDHLDRHVMIGDRADSRAMRRFGRVLENELRRVRLVTEQGSRHKSLSYRTQVVCQS